MQVLCVLRRRTEAFAESDFSALLDEEAARARALYAEGIVRMFWSRADVPGAVLLVEAESLEAAERAVASLPFAARGMVEAQTIELRPYRGVTPQ